MKLVRAGDLGGWLVGDSRSEVGNTVDDFIMRCDGGLSKAMMAEFNRIGDLDVLGFGINYFATTVVLKGHTNVEACTSTVIP